MWGANLPCSAACCNSTLDGLARLHYLRTPKLQSIQHDHCRSATARYSYVFVLASLCGVERMKPGVGGKLLTAHDQAEHDCKEDWRYVHALQYAIATLQAAGARQAITVLVHSSFDKLGLRAPHSSLAAWFARRHVAVCRVPGMGSPSRPDMYYFSKLHAFQLTQFERVAVYDTDHLWVGGNPDGVFEWCGDAAFCAVLDNPPGFNMGAFVLRPNITRAPDLLRRWESCLDPNSTDPGPHCTPGNRAFMCSENHCMQKIVTGVRGMAPEYNLLHTPVDSTKGRWDALKAAALGDCESQGHNRSVCDSNRTVLEEAVRMKLKRESTNGFGVVSLHAKFWRASCDCLSAYFEPLLRSAQEATRL